MFTGHARYARPLLREESLLDAAQEERPVISSARLGAGPGTSPSEETTTSEQESLQLVGRSELLDRAVNLVEVGGNVLLFGADGCGRTAFLHEVVRRLATEKRVTRLIDGSGVDEPQRLVGHIVRACGLTVPSDLDVPSMLGCLPPPRLSTA
jgi:Cdc6-like AAA superfamily ATPase